MTSAPRSSAGSTTCWLLPSWRRNPIEPIDRAPAEPGPGGKESLAFRLDRSFDGRLSGWIVDLADPGSPVKCMLVLGGTTVATVRADQPRPDVPRRYGRRHGFAVAIDPAWSGERPRTVRFVLADGRRTGPAQRVVALADPVPWLERQVAANPGEHELARELGSALARAARTDARDMADRRGMLTRAVAFLDRAAESESKHRRPTLIKAAQLLIELDQPRDALDRIDKALAGEPDSRSAWLARSRALIALGDLAGALGASRHLLTLHPGHAGAEYQVRTLASAAELDLPRPPARLLMSIREAELARTWSVLAARLAEGVTASDWVLIADDRPDGDALLRLAERAPPWAGRLVDGEGERKATLWRAELIGNLIRSRLVSGDDPTRALRAVAELVATPGSGRRIAAGHPSGTVLCLSRYGSRMFGGGEQFLRSMADHYARAGYDPVIAGAQPGQAEESGTLADGRRWMSFDADVDALRRSLVRARPAAVHVLSGLGFEVAHALQYLDIPFVYGVHYWRDLLGATEESERYFSDGDQGPIARRLFALIVERAAVVYANSGFTQSVVEQSVRLRAPVVVSIPGDAVTPDDPAAAATLLDTIEDYVLLLNGRMDKGFALLLDIAARLPDVAFVAVASQSERGAAEAAAGERGLRNVHVLARTDRPDLLYRRALATAVPSYRFVESFSRVCIEAQRFGCPVIGSDVGNVPRLLERSGVALPELPELWAVEIRRLKDDRQYRAERRAGALENSARYGEGVQVRQADRLIAGLGRSMLVAVGSGIGNMLHVGPMLRVLARSLGRPVDLLVAEDHADSLFLLHDPDVVRSVFALAPAVLRRRYDTIFVTHSFGSMRPPFSADRVLFSRDWQPFDPAGPLHETVFNLEAAQALLGIAWSASDLEGGYVGELRYRPPAGGRLVGFHGGSKPGFWSAKRWPGFPELARRLGAAGWDCASFGTAEEYVDGTIDRTGGTIEEMATALCECSYVVSNDSGVMNIANALGIPLTALFAPTNPATRGPLRTTSQVVQARTSCAPCEVTPDGRGIFQAGRCGCIATIEVDRVEASVRAHMATLGLAPGRAQVSAG